MKLFPLTVVSIVLYDRMAPIVPYALHNLEHNTTY